MERNVRASAGFPMLLTNPRSTLNLSPTTGFRSLGALFSQFSSIRAMRPFLRASHRSRSALNILSTSGNGSRVALLTASTLSACATLPTSTKSDSTSKGSRMPSSSRVLPNFSSRVINQLAVESLRSKTLNFRPSTVDFRLQLTFDCGLHLGGQLRERRRVSRRHIGEHLAVELHAQLLQAVNKLA